MMLIPTKPSDLFQIDLSYFYNADDKLLNLILHVPMVQHNQLMNIFQFLPMSSLSKIRQNFTMTPSVDKDIIAVGQNNQFQLKTYADLQKCDKLGTFFLCHNGYSTQNNIERTCLGALFLENWDAANKLCQFKFTSTQEQVVKISAHNWLISSPLNFTTTIKCSKTFSNINIKTLSIITIPELCSVTLKTHIIHTYSYTDSETEVKHFKWQILPEQQFLDYQSPMFNNIINSIPEEYPFTIPEVNKMITKKKDSDLQCESEKLQLIESIKQTDNHVHPNFTLYSILSIIIITCSIGLYHIKKYIASRPQPVRLITQHHKKYNAPMEMKPIRTDIEDLEEGIPNLEFKDTKLELLNTPQDTNIKYRTKVKYPYRSDIIA